MQPHHLQVQRSREQLRRRLVRVRVREDEFADEQLREAGLHGAGGAREDADAVGVGPVVEDGAEVVGVRVWTFLFYVRCFVFFFFFVFEKRKKKGGGERLGELEAGGRTLDGLGVEEIVAHGCDVGVVELHFCDHVW